MVLKEITSEQDRINIALEMYKFTGIKEKTLRKTKIGWLFVYSIGIVAILVGLWIRYLDKGDLFQYFLYIFGIIYILRPTLGLLFLEKEYNTRTAKKIRKYDKDILKKYDLSENIEGSIEITDSYIETSSLGTISKYNLQDVHALIWIMDKIMTKIYIKEKPVHIQFQFVTKVLNNFSQISSYILLEGIENGVLKIDVSKATMMKVDDIKTNTINIIYKYCFNFIDKIDSNIFTTVKKESIREYIQIIGAEHYKNYVKMIIDELSIVDEIELNFRFMTFKTMNPRRIKSRFYP